MENSLDTTGNDNDQSVQPLAFIIAWQCNASSRGVNTSQAPAFCTANNNVASLSTLKIRWGITVSSTARVHELILKNLVAATRNGLNPFGDSAIIIGE